jgi:hypothetical protein
MSSAAVTAANQHPFASVLRNPHERNGNSHLNPSPSTDVLKIDLLQIDGQVVPDNLHKNPKFASDMLKQVVNAPRTASTWYYQPGGLPLKTYNYLEFVWNRYDFPVAVIEPNPENGAIPMVNREVEKFKGVTKRFAVGANFNASELRGMTAEDQEVNILYQTSLQLQNCASETLGSIVMRTFAQVSDTVREIAMRDNIHFSAMKTREWFQYLQATHGCASRGNGGIHTAMQNNHNLRRMLGLPKVQHMVIHQNVAALLPKDNREFFLGGNDGLSKFKAGADGITNIAGMNVNIGDTFRNATIVQAENVLLTRSTIGEWYYAHEPSAFHAAQDKYNWKGVKLFNMDVDNFETLTPHEMLTNCLWFGPDGQPSEALKQLRDDFNNEQNGSRDPNDHSFPPLASARDMGAHGANYPGGKQVYGRNAFAGRLGKESSFSTFSPDPMIAVYHDGDSKAKAELVSQIGHINQQYLSEEQMVAAIERALETNGENPTKLRAANARVGAAFEPEVSRNALEAGNFVAVPNVENAKTAEQVLAIAMDFQAAHLDSALFQHRDSGAFAIALDNGASHPEYIQVDFEAMEHGNGLLPIALRPRSNAARASAGAGAKGSKTASSDTSIPITEAISDSAEKPRASRKSDKSAKAGSALIGAPADDIDFTDAGDKVDVGSGEQRKNARYKKLQEIFRDRGADKIIEEWLKTPIANLKDHLQVYNMGKPYPFRMRLIRDQITYNMTAAILYADDAGNTLMSEVHSVTSMDSSNFRGQVTFEFNAAGLITDDKRVQIIPNIAYNSYVRGKGLRFTNAEEFQEWVHDPLRMEDERGDIICVGMGWNSTERDMEYCSLTGHFDFRGYPVRYQADTVNSGYWTGLELARRALNLDEFEQNRQPREEFTVAEPHNVNLARGTALAVSSHDVWCPGTASLDGHDFAGVRAVRQGSELRVDSIQNLFHKP